METPLQAFELGTVWQIVYLISIAILTFNSVRLYLYFQGKGTPFAVERLSPEELPLPPNMTEHDEVMREHGFKLIGIEKVKLFRDSKEMLNYVYLSARRDTFAEVHFLTPKKVFMALISRFSDDAAIVTTFPIGESIRKPHLSAAFAAYTPHSLFPYHAAALEAGSRRKGAPVTMRNWADIQVTEDVFRQIQRDTLMRRSTLVRLVVSLMYATGLVITIFEMARALTGMPPSILEPFGWVAVLGIFAETVLQWWLQSPTDAIDAKSSMVTA